MKRKSIAGDALDLVVFDLVGTTIQTTDQVPAAFEEAFAEIGISLSDAEIAAIRGLSKRQAVHDLLAAHRDALSLTEPGADQVYARFRRLLSAKFETAEAREIAGADDVFAWLKARGIKVALTTGFDRDLVDMILTKLNWLEMVDAVICNSDVPRGRPAPYLIFRAMEWTDSIAVDRLAVLGDTRADLMAAANAGVRWSIGVLSGAHMEQQLRSCPHSAILTSVRQLPEYIGRHVDMEV